jgi:glycosyltransferase involved in cell wall biosynthesis
LTRILEIVSGAGVNGATSHVALLVRELVRRGHDVTVICRPGAWVGDRSAEAGARVVPSDLHRLPPDELRRMADLCRRERPDVLHTHMSRAHFFGVLLGRLGGVPCVATAHSQKLQLHWRANDAVIAVSDATARFQRLYNCVPAARLHVVHGFVEPPFRLPSHIEREALRTSLDAGTGDVLVGTAARLIPAKGVQDLLQAVALLRRRVPALLVVAGSGERAHEERLRAEAGRLGVPVRWLGFRDDLHRLLPAFDVFATASRREALPMVVLEAMAAGLPVVATRVGGLPEAVEEGVTGLLVPRRAPVALADALERILLDEALALAMGTAARRRVLGRFTPESQIPRIEEVLAKVLPRCAPDAFTRSIR